MNRRRLALFLTLSITADVVAVWSGTGKVFPTPALVAAYGLMLGQVGLGAVWLGIGAARFGARIASHVAVFLGAYFLYCALEGNGGAWLRLLIMQSLAIIVPLFLARAYGLRLQAHGLELPGLPWQFTLKHLFVITTAAAVLLGAVRLVQPWLTSQDTATEAYILGVGFALTALVAVWASLGRGRWTLKLIALPAVALLVGVLFVALEGRRSLEADLGVIAIVLIHTLFITASFICLRRAGYRLVRRRQDRSLACEP